MILLNIGCGLTKLPGFINIDSDPNVNPDQVIDIVKGLPFKDDSVETIYFSHTIEHINEKLHNQILTEFWRVLVHGGMLFLSYPEFKKCAQNYIDNYRGQREYWKATIFGRQLSKDDFHVSLMDTDFLIPTLQTLGFSPIFHKEEPNNPHNTIIKCFKYNEYKTYEEVLATEIFNDTSRVSS